MNTNTQKHTSLATQSGMEVRSPAPGRLARIKPYKAAAPHDTVSDIRSRLAALGMSFVEEAIHGEEISFSYCLRLVDDVRGEPVFQTMGKGRSDSYTKASAYGEMIERIQNLAFYMMLMYPSEPETGCSFRNVPFKYYPDEKALAGEELRRGIGRLFRDDSTADDFRLAEPAIGVPFWNVFGSRAEYLPFRVLQVIVGSNGMCSGNTPAEALIHGICEVFERHVLKQLFLSPCSLPDVPLELFAGQDIHKDLNRLAESKEYRVRVKDCSLGLRLPVIGLLIRNNSFLGFPSYHVYIPGIGEITNALNNAFAKKYLAFDRQVHVLTNPAGATLAQREEAVHAMDRYAAVAPSRKFCAADYLMHYLQHPLIGMPQSALQHFLLQPGPLAKPLDLPACFGCASCRCVSRCNYLFISTIWNRLKKAMSSSTWNYNTVRPIATGEMVIYQPAVPGENSHCDHARPDAIL